MNEPFTEILFGASRSLIMKVVGLLTAYLFAFVVARFFGAQAWGEFSLALSIILFGAIIGTAGLDMALVKITAGLNGKEELSSSYKSSLIITFFSSICASILIYFSSDWISNAIFNNPELSQPFKIAAFAVLPLSLINLNAAILQGLERINKYIFIRFVSRHVTALMLLLLMLLIYNNTQLVLISYVGGLYLVVILSFYWLIKENIQFYKTGGTISSERYFSLLKLSLPLFFAGSLVFFNAWIDTMMVGAFLSEQDVGVYNISLKVSGILLLIWTSVNVVVTPKFSDLYSKNKIDELKEITRYSTSLIFYCTLPMFLVLILFPDEILFIFGKEFITGKNALIILSAGNLFGALAGSVGYFMQMTDSQVAFQNITLLSFLLSFIANFILIPIYGIEGAAIATCISIIFWKVSAAVFVKYKYNIITYYRPFYNNK